MARVKRGVTARARHKKVVKLAKGYRGRGNNVFRVAIERIEKGLQYAYRDRRRRKRDFRRLWITRINAAARQNGMFFKGPETGGGFSRAANARRCAFNGINELAGGRCNTAEMTHEIERDAFACEDRSRRTLDHGDVIAGANGGSVFANHSNLERSIHQAKSRAGQIKTGHNPFVTRRQGDTGDGVFGHDRL